jgi:hypothetical protein
MLYKATLKLQVNFHICLYLYLDSYLLQLIPVFFLKADYENVLPAAPTIAVHHL